MKPVLTDNLLDGETADAVMRAGAGGHHQGVDHLGWSWCIGMFLSLGNIVETAKIGLLFIDFETPNRVRVQATASMHREDELLATYPGAIAIVRAQVDKVFINCARYIHKHQRVETSKYVPDANGEQPYPTWKRIDGLQDHLHPKDRGRAEAADGLITEEEYGAAVAAGES